MVTTRRASANGIEIGVMEQGAGPVVLLLHGWPHAKELWRPVMDALSADYRVVAPDLRGIGGTDRPRAGYDLHTLADDAAGLLDALAIDRVALIGGVDLGAPIAWMTAARHPRRVERLAVMEATLGRLPGAEAFFAAGAPWWFGFHAVPGLAETVVADDSNAYIDWFLRAGTRDGRGVGDDLRTAFHAAYAGAEGLRGGFEQYRAMAANAQLIAATAADADAVPHQPVLALGAATVGDALARQLAPFTPQLHAELIADCGHIIPADAPHALAGLLREHLGRSVGT